VIELREIGMQSEYLINAHVFGLAYELLDVDETLHPFPFENITKVLAAHLALEPSTVDDWPPA
jgi:hypothetical protein